MHRPPNPPHPSPAVRGVKAGEPLADLAPTARALARRIDVSAVQASNARVDVESLATIARRYGFITAHVLPGWVPLLRSLLEGSSTLVGAPVGFPAGGSTTTVKVVEARDLLDAGAQEMDVVVNIGRLRSGDTDYVRHELNAIAEAIGHAVPLKVILEVGYLDEGQIRAGCEAAIEAGADFVKTGTGWSGRPTTIEHVRLIHGFVGGAIEIKASGGIRELDTVLEMERLGVTRFGINTPAAVALLEEATRRATMDRGDGGGA